jgi:hypothetical protein
VTPHRQRWRTTVDGEPRKYFLDGVVTKLTRGKRSRAHNSRDGALGDDGDELEWPGHVRAVVAVLRQDAGKTTAIRALRVVEVGVSGRGDARE